MRLAEVHYFLEVYPVLAHVPVEKKIKKIKILRCGIVMASQGQWRLQSIWCDDASARPHAPLFFRPSSAQIKPNARWRDTPEAPFYVGHLNHADTSGRCVPCGLEKAHSGTALQFFRFFPLPVCGTVSAFVKCNIGILQTVMEYYLHPVTLSHNDVVYCPVITDASTTQQKNLKSTPSFQMVDGGINFFYFLLLIVPTFLVIKFFIADSVGTRSWHSVAGALSSNLGFNGVTLKGWLLDKGEEEPPPLPRFEFICRIQVSF